MKQKKIVPIIALIVLVISIVMLLLQPNFIQIDDTVISDTYYDTAMEAYEKSDENIDIKEELFTEEINSQFALWFAETTDNELAVMKMVKKDNKYFSLGDVSIYSIKTLKNSEPSLDDEFTLGDNTLEFVIILESEFDKSPLAKQDLKTTKFIFNNLDFIFAYK